MKNSVTVILQLSALDGALETKPTNTVCKIQSFEHNVLLSVLRLVHTIQFLRNFENVTDVNQHFYELKQRQGKIGSCEPAFKQ